MQRIFKHILIMVILFGALQASGQYIIDRVCVGSVRYYRVDGEPGSTYTWKITDISNNVTTLASTADTTGITWNVPAGSYKLSVIQHSVFGCDGVIEIGDINVYDSPQAEAGNSNILCDLVPVQLNQSSASNYSHLLWITRGDGVFSNDTILHPTYSPGPGDIAAGSVRLVLTAFGLGDTSACLPARDSLLLMKAPDVMASAGPDEESCKNLSFQFTQATASNYGRLVWTHNGLGTIVDPTVINPVYIPGANETGVITFHLRAYEILPCLDSIEDQMQLTIYPTPTAILSLAGSDTLCGGDTTTLRVDLTGIPPWSFTISNGISTQTYTNVMTTPFFADVVPSETSTYIITGLNDLHCPGPSGVSGSVFIIVHPRPGAEYTWNYGSQNNEIIFQIDSAIVNWPAVGNMILWYFGDGTFGYETNPVHIYPAPGTYEARLTVTDTNGCTSTVTHLITIPVVPIAFFGSTTPACSGNPVCFTDLSTVPAPPFGYITKWVWNFGDGTPEVTINFPDNPNVCHTYAQIGTYPATLTITANTGYVSHCTRNQVVIPTPVADFSNSGACEGQSVSFTDLSNQNNGGSILTWNWNFGDPLSGTDNTSTLQNPVHTFTSGNTTYQVRLVITNMNTCSDTIIKPVFVRPAPPVEFVHDSACLASVIHFNGNTGITQPDSIGSWSWDFGDGTPASSSPLTTTHTYSLPGTYITTLTVTDLHGCINSVAHEINVHVLPVAQFSWSNANCAGASVQFTDASTVSPGYIAKWQWDFGDGSPLQTILVPGSPNVTHVFPASNSTYNVILKVWSNDSCMQETSHTIILNGGPVADFSTSPVTCEAQPVQFTDASQSTGGNISGWNWNFGDPASGTSNTSTLQNPAHTFGTAGNYNIRLVVSNTSGCTDTIIKVISINLPPVADFINDTACLNSATTFTSTSVPNAANILSYNWNFGDGSTSNVQNPVHTYSGEGTFTVTLQILNSNGCTDEVQKAVYVRPLPVASFEWSPNNCLGSPVEFTNTSTVPGLSQIIRWEWNFDDGTTASIHYPASPVIQHVFAGNALSHNVRLTVVTADSCRSFIDHVVTSVASPTAMFESVQQACENMPVAFTDLSQTNGGGNITSWNYNFGDPASGTSNTSTLPNPVHVFSAAGSYTVTLIVANANGCQDTIQKNITIVTRPTVAFTADTACLTNPTHFTSQTSASITQWHWNFGDGFTSTVANPTHTYATAGNFEVTLEVFAGESCSNSVTRQVAVLGNPQAAFTATAPGCTGDSIQFTDLSATPQGYITSWTWDFGDGSPAVTKTLPQSPNVSHLYLNPNTYNAKLTVTTNNGCTGEKILPVIIHAAPVANFVFQNNSCEDKPVLFTNTTMVQVGSPVSQWLWNFDDPGSGVQNTSTLENPVHIFSSNGTYHVVLHATNIWGCSDSVVKTVTIKSAPVAQFTSDVACSGTPTQFTDGSTTASGTIITWLWNFGDPASGISNTSNLQNPTHIFSSNGTFQVTLTVINSNSCTNDTVIPVVVNPAPDAMFRFTNACAGNETQFTDLSIAPNSNIIAWFWDFGDGVGTSTVQNPAYVYTASGTYNVKLRVTNLNQCTDSIVLPVTTVPGPNAAFQYTSSYCPAGKVTFQDISQGNGAAITERLWIFEPGYTSSSPNPTYIFGTTDTTYQVTLIVKNGNGCSDTIINPVYVKPGSAFSFTNDTACYAFPVQFHPQNLTPGDSLYYVTWNFGDPQSGGSNISHSYNAAHTFTRTGHFTVMLAATNSDGCIDSVYRDIEVNNPPAPMFSYVVNPTGMVEFTDQSTAGTGSIVSWEWTFGDGSAPVVIYAPGPGNINHQYNGGYYQVSLKVTNEQGCSSVYMKTIYLNIGITASFDHTDSIVCARYPVIFHDHSAPHDMINRWRWYFGDNKDTTYTTYTPTLVHVFDVSGIYHVKLVISTVIDGSSISDTTEQVVIVNGTPDPQFTSIANCVNSPSQFNDVSGNAGIILAQREWDFGDPASGAANHSELKDPVHRYTTAGNYDVKLVLINSAGCKDSLIHKVYIHAQPKAAFENTLACSGNPTFFTDQSVPGDTTLHKWQWNFGVPGIKKDTSLEQNPVYYYKTSGTYPVRLMVKDDYGCYDTVDSTVTVFTSPVSAFRLVDNYEGKPGKILLNNESVGASAFYWDFGNGIHSTDENPIITYSEDGTYLIKLISYSNNECTDTTFYRYDMVFKGLYVPNAFAPTTNIPGVAEFRPVGINLQKYKIEVFDSWGHLLWQSDKIDALGSPTEGWDGKDQKGRLMPQGTYMWKVTATFTDGSIWQGSDIGKGEYKSIGTVTLIR